MRIISDYHRPLLNFTVPYTEVDDKVIVLNVRDDKYEILNTTSAFIWIKITNKIPAADIVKSYTKTFSVTPEIAQTDLENTLNIFKSSNYFFGQKVELKPFNSRLSFLQTLPILQAYFSMIRASYMLSKHGFEYTFLEVISLLPHKRIRKPEELKKYRSIFLTAENCYFRKMAPDDCLSRSIGLLYFLLLQGFPAKLCLGARLFPFRSHAWVEVNNQAVMDSENLISTFSIFKYFQ